MTQKQPPTYRNIPVRGTFYRTEDEREVAEMCRPGYKLMLEREPENRFDKNAIKVLTGNINYHVGYIGKEFAREIASWLDKGWFFVTTVTGKKSQNLIVELDPVLPKEEEIDDEEHNDPPLEALTADDIY